MQRKMSWAKMTALSFMRNSDQRKCGSLMTGLKQQHALGDKRHPEALDKAVDAVNKFKSTEASLAARRNNLSKSNALLQEKLRLLKQDILKSDNYNMGIDKW